ncbi:hypothetical protein GDO81_028748 [Engystomops pustulosus]|uniref:Uncharacterized protein n=1 Tax=Engystomops pustulosus TaxID=76066 RepID=A0AAV6YJH8_ENGPU|nr:hypothetical protein GDO81_028748 [Engystomops pustulosus]
MVKVGEREPFIRICACGRAYSALIRANVVFLNPICCRVASRKPQSTLSNAFSASNERSKNGVELDFAWCSREKDFRVLSLASRVGIKPT